ncbi:hypothetical protein LCGC14_1299550 [marine sediment metagenome]|uniref:Uncharacterized protein n=1 Tax=marine sediment metagenome TaxID=412755 RepID=A0A0F9KQE6_9ZZZZ
MSKPYDPCIHHTPDAGGSVASELHGICIFCWRDRLGVQVKKTLELEQENADLYALVAKSTAQIEQAIVDLWWADIAEDRAIVAEDKATKEKASGQVQKKPSSS